MKRRISSLLISIIVVLGVSLAITTPNVAAQASAEYSCGAYGTNNYSNGNDCSGNNNDNSGSTNATAPNTGFAVLTRPDVYVPLGLSILAIAAGIALLLKRRKKNISLGS